MDYKQGENKYYIRHPGLSIGKIFVDNPFGNAGILEFDKCNDCDSSYGNVLFLGELIISGIDRLELRYAGEIYIRDLGDRTIESVRHMAFGNGRRLFKAVLSGRRSGGYYRVTSSFDPWTPPPVPEPTTYGAIFGAVGLGLATVRRRFRAYGRSLAGHRSP